MLIPPYKIFGGRGRTEAPVAHPGYGPAANAIILNVVFILSFFFFFLNLPFYIVYDAYQSAYNGFVRNFHIPYCIYIYII